MNKKLSLKQVIVSIFLMLFLTMVSENINAGWSQMDGTVSRDGYFDIWGTSPTDVFVSGCLGTRMHYDGNTEEIWYEWPKMQGH